ncbi:MAG TPA: hypothetical protein VMF89_06570 [Polyangiales bacterium]|nr:hypothetical protein [Polyangiales bacterium]
MKKQFAMIAGHEYQVLSLYPEWAWAIVFAGKDVENRSWRTSYRGTLLIHASSRRSSHDALDNARKLLCERSKLRPKDLPDEFPCSAIIGAVELVDCVEGGKSAWAEKDSVHWLLRGARPLPRPIPDIAGQRRVWQWTPTKRQLAASARL